MINLEALEESTEVTKVEPVDAIFTELGNNTYDYKDLISELVDNSIAAKRRNVRLKVDIEIFIDDDNSPVRFIIRDNASGISKERLGVAITPAGVQSTESLNEHGLGMKQAVASLGTLEYLAMRTTSEKRARVVREFRFGDLDNYFCDDFPYDAGTEISMAEVAVPEKLFRSMLSRIHCLEVRWRGQSASMPQNPVNHAGKDEIVLGCWRWRRRMENTGGAVQRCAILAGESPARGIVGSPR